MLELGNWISVRHQNCTIERDRSERRGQFPKTLNPVTDFLPRVIRHSLQHRLVASEHTLMAIAGHVSRKMIEHYSHIRIEAKRAALDAIAKPASQAVSGVGVAQNWAQSPSHEKAVVRN